MGLATGAEAIVLLNGLPEAFAPTLKEEDYSHAELV
jgi:hypothetical protein